MSGCVSVNLPLGKPAKAKDIALTEPAEPFAKFSTGAVDRAWQNKKNGNTIGYLTDCNPSDDLDLKALESEALSALNSLKVTAHDNFSFNDREAIRTTAQGQVDGVSVSMSLVIFKKNGCSFTLSYVGRSKVFQTNETDFTNFVERFQVP